MTTLRIVYHSDVSQFSWTSIPIKDNHTKERWQYDTVETRNTVTNWTRKFKIINRTVLTG